MPMTPDGIIEGLTPASQAIVNLALLLVTVFGAGYAYVKTSKAKLPEAESDYAVISGNLADTRPFKNMATMLKEMLDEHKQANKAAEKFQEEWAKGIEALVNIAATMSATAMEAEVERRAKSLSAKWREENTA